MEDMRLRFFACQIHALHRVAIPNKGQIMTKRMQRYKKYHK